jgi:hypothetical protein
MIKSVCVVINALRELKVVIGGQHVTNVTDHRPVT